MTRQSPITTHVLDTSRGAPAQGVAVQLDKLDAAGQWRLVGSGSTNQDGRIVELIDAPAFSSARYRLTFRTGDYFSAQGVVSFYPRVVVEFETTDGDQHCHVPLLLSPFGYSTYRGS